MAEHDIGAASPLRAAPLPGQFPDDVVAALRGRDAELTAVADCLSAAVHGGGRVLVVDGPPGIGKSRLLAEAQVMAERSGVRTVRGEAFASRQTVPFAPLLQATLGAEPPIGDADAVRRLSARTDLQYWVVHDLQSALESAAAESPLAVVLDDLHWSDAGTLVALRSLTANLAHVGIVWLLSARAGACRPEVRDTATALERAGARRLRIAAVPPPVVAAIVEDVVHARPDPGLLALAQKARGNPFLLVELLRGLCDEGRLRVTGGVARVIGAGLPRRLAGSMEERIGELPDATRQLVRTASVLPQRFTAGQLAAMLHRPASTLLVPLEEAFRADLLADTGDHLEFRHDLLREATRDMLPRSLRRALEREAATLLLQAGARPAEVALQLAESAEIGDRAAIATLRDAARAIAGSDAATAADLSVRALQLLPPEDAERGHLVAETVVLLHEAMRSDEAQALADTALAGVLPPEEEAAVRLSLAGMTTRLTPARAQESRRALALPGLSPVTRGRHQAWLGYNLVVSGELDLARPALDAATAAARATGDPQTHTMAELGRACLEHSSGSWSRALERLERIRSAAGDRSAPGPAIVDFHYVNVLAVLGRIEEARAARADGVKRAQRERNSRLLTSWTFVGGLLDLSAGRLSDARAEAEAGGLLDTEVNPANFDGVVQLMTLGQLARHTGDRRAARLAVAAATSARTDGSPAVRHLAGRVLAGAAMARGEPAAAAALLADDPLRCCVAMLPGDFGYHPWAAQIAVAAGDPVLARRCLDATAAFAGDSPGVPLIEGVAAHTRGVVHRDAAALLEAARLLAGSARPLLFAAAAESAGRQLLEEGRRDEAIEQLDTAFDVFRAHEATVDARRVGRILRSHGAPRRIVTRPRPRRGWESLTASELRVVRLVAGGATNNSAAEQLFLSPHTVSSHLRNAFAKLGINSRLELARMVADLDH